ncbi:MAG: peroxiredoxin [Candidatus Brocadiia bacterium]
MSEDKTARPLGVGDPVPNVSLLDSQGETVRLRDLLGDRNVVLFFYPKDGTLFCTREACGFRDAYEEFAGLDADVIGVSSDAPESHRAFAGKHGLPFTLLSDPDGAARRQFGTGRTLGVVPGRVTYVIDREGIIRDVISSQFRPGKHVEEALRALRESTQPD